VSAAIRGVRGSILVVDDTPANLGVLVDYLGQHDYKVLVSRDGEGALEQARLAKPDVILLDVMMPGMDGYECCRRLKDDDELREIPVIFMTALDATKDKVQGFEVGAVDFVTKPIQHEEVLARVEAHLTIRKLQRELQEANRELEERVTERTQELTDALAEVKRLKSRLESDNVYLREEIEREHDFQEIVRCSESMQRVLEKVTQVASTDATVLVLGETGTGKELIARALHQAGSRKARPLVKVNCAALPVNLIESELFGHERGAFTGALSRRIGRFELADGGTILLDEIGDLPLELQAKFLRVLQEGEIERLGSSRSIPVDVRVIAATNRDLSAAIRDGTFREDLYYRLNVFPVEVPPLRERPEDIPILAEHFLRTCGTKLGKKLDRIPPKVLSLLEGYSWPGNIRELQNVIERAIILSTGPELQLEETLVAESPPTEAVDGTLEDVERRHILRVLEASDWIIEGKRAAATRLGLNPSTLRSRMEKLGIKKARRD